MEDKPKTTSHKVAGVVIAVLLILLALIFVFFSRINIEKKPSSSNKTKTEVSTGANETKNVSSSGDTSVSNNATKPTSTVAPESTKVEGNKEKPSSEVADNSQSLVKIVNENKLDYTASELSTSGVVSSRECYLQGNQVIFLVNIDIQVGTATQTVKYYCTHSVYSEVSDGDILTVKYQQVSASAFAVVSISK